VGTGEKGSQKVGGVAILKSALLLSLFFAFLVDLHQKDDFMLFQYFKCVS
jgi:hypothetical protein